MDFGISVFISHTDQLFHSQNLPVITGFNEPGNKKARPLQNK